MVELTAAHWVYVFFVVLVLITMASKRETPMVMASHGLTGLEHVLFGSTAERVLRGSPCNVLVIKASP